VLDFKGLVILSDNVVLVEDVTEKVPVIELVKNRTIYLFRQGLEPVLRLASVLMKALALRRTEMYGNASETAAGNIN
jgi:hypothetical protein